MPRAEDLIASRYRLVRPLGQGQMGAVYLAHDTRLMDRACAIKLLHPGRLDAPHRQRFERESRIMARLNSPHIVQLLDVGLTPDGQPFLALEYLEGRPLSAAFSPEAPLPLASALRITRQILRGLSAAHAAGIIHRDLSLNNVFLVRTEGGAEHVKIFDFGLAKDSTGLSGEALTQRGTALGTPTHMSPEQFQGLAIDHRADLYAVGVILYRMISGQPPFQATAELPESIGRLDPILRIGWQHIKRRPPLIEGLHPWLWAYIERLLAKDPERRFQGAEAALVALDEAERALASPQPASGPSQPVDEAPPLGAEALDTTRPTSTIPPALTRRRAALIIALLALSALTIGILQLW
ncbi:serine/threonine protein kinase [Myxococcota bacterium]|nr:serine/threonine protein kinase [Myxococcota bacterium]MBU1898488.1 serine/threonine protein kinase [Myxococcota bacterium]